MTGKQSSLWIANIVAYVLTLVVNGIAMLLPLNGITTKQMSAMYPTLVTPPDITFSIWMLIYIALGVFIVTSIFTKVRKDAEAIGPYFIITCVLNIAWLFTWHFQLITLSFIIIVGLLVVLFKIYKITRDSSFIAKHTFSIYYAWITVAALVSAFVFGKTLAGGAPVTPIQPRSSSYMLEESAADDIVSLDPPTRLLPDVYDDIMLIDAIGEPVPINVHGTIDIWDGQTVLIGGDPEIVSYVTTLEYVLATIAVILVGAVTIVHIYRYHDLTYVLTILWALGGIAVRQLQSPTPPIYMLIVAATTVLAVLYAVFARIVKHRDVCIRKDPSNTYHEEQ